MTTKNYVIEYRDWDSYNASSKEDAIKQFKKEHEGSEIIEVKE